MNFLKNNLILKILALLFAVFLWIFVINEGFRADYLEKEVPVRAYNLREDLALALDLGSVKLKVRAPESVWQKLEADNLEAYVDLKTFDPGEYDVEVKVSFQDPKIQVLEKEPSKVRVRLEFITKTKKEVKAEIKGEPAEGFYAAALEILPKEIELSGAKSLLERVDSVLAIFELRGESEEVKTEAVLKAFDIDGNEVKNVFISPERAQVRVSILKETGTKNVEVRARISGEPKAGFSYQGVEIYPAVVSVSADVKKIKEIDFVETAEIDLSGASSSFEKKISLALPRDIQATPSEVTAKVIIVSQKKERSFEVPVSYKNLGTKLKVDSLSPANVSLVLEGEASMISALQAKSISINLDLKDKGAGTHTFAITPGLISLPEGVSLRSLETKEVRVALSQK